MTGIQESAESNWRLRARSQSGHRFIPLPCIYENIRATFDAPADNMEIQPWSRPDHPDYQFLDTVFGTTAATVQEWKIAKTLERLREFG